MVWSSGGASRGLASRMALHGLPLAVATAGACAFDFGGVVYDDGASPTPTASGSTTSGGDGGATSSTGQGAAGGGGGGPVACGDVQCPIVECYETSCVGESCLLAPLDAGSPCGPGGAQTCTESQDCVACAEQADCAPPLSSCRTVSCVAGACVESAIPEGGSCTGEEGLCTAQQVCVQCIAASDCADGDVCDDGACTTPAATCSDGTQNAGETAVDCGGPCPSCANGLTCAVAADCQSGYCSGVCSPCQIQADCGGSGWCDGGACVARKGNGVECTSGIECVSTHCVDGVCCNEPCGGTCSSCRASATGSADGTCGPSVVGSDPDDECLAAACRSGECDGTGQCGVLLGSCDDACMVESDVAYLYSNGVCVAGECSHTFRAKCPEGTTCNAEQNGCAP